MALSPEALCQRRSAGRFSLPERLHSRSEYLQVQNLGRKFRSQRLVLMVGQGRPPGATAGHTGRMGYTVSRKVGNAVVRNRIRRVLKEAVRQDAAGLCRGFDHVVVAYPGAALISATHLREELMCLLQRARAWAQPAGSATGSSCCTG